MKKLKVTVVVLAVFLITAGAWIATRSSMEDELAQRYPMTIYDDFGRVVTISRTPERIVSLVPSYTEILFALGLENKIAGVTNYCDYPPEAKNKENVGGFSTPSIEKIVALAPDLILATDIHKDIINKQMESLGLKIVAINPKNVNGILDRIRLVGQITGRTDAAERLTLNMKQRIDKIADVTKNLLDRQKPKVFLIYWLDPLMTWGPDTFGNELIQLAGGINIAADATTKYPLFSMEVLVERNPDVVIASASHGSGGATVESVKNLLAGKNIAAIMSNRVYSIDTSLIGRTGPRIVDGLEAMARFIHPELFP